IEMGEGVMEASLNGSREIGFTIVSMTVSLVAVFIPVLFMGGILGRLFREFAVTISVAILVSGIVSLTLTPMLASKLLKASAIRESALHDEGGKAHRGGWWGFTEGIYNRVLQFYEWSLSTVLRHPLYTVTISLILAVFTFYLFTVVPKGFIPSGDTGLLFGNTEAAQGISLDDMIKHSSKITDIIKNDPNVQSYASTVGSGGRNSGGNSGTIFIGLKPLKQRKSADEVIEELRPKVSREAGLRVILQNPPSLNVGGGFGRSTYQVTIQASNTSELADAAPTLEKKMRELPILQDVNSNLQINTPQMNVDIDRKAAAMHNVTIAQIQTALGDAFGSRQVSTIYMPANEYQVILEAKPEFQSDPTALGRLYIHASNGRLVPLSAVASFSKTVGP